MAGCQPVMQQSGTFMRSERLACLGSESSCESCMPAILPSGGLQLTSGADEDLSA